MRSVRPFCVTVDFETLGEKDAALRDTVTLRERDSMKQERVAIQDLRREFPTDPAEPDGSCAVPRILPRQISHDREHAIRARRSRVQSRGKMFALAALDEVPTTVNLKCDPDLALELRDRYQQVTPGYHMNKKHWNTVGIEGGIPDPELRKMIDHSYDLVARGLPKPRAKVAARSRRNSTAARRGRR